MSSTQKIIKYLAIALAFSLIFSIISSIFTFFSSMGRSFKNYNNTDISQEIIKIAEDENDIKILDLNIKSSNITIKVGDAFKAETTNKNVDYKKEHEKIIIKEKNYNWLKNQQSSEIVIYIPENMILDGVNINNGAGIINIEKLSTKILHLDLGAGKTNINNLKVFNNSVIDGGVGEVIIKNSQLNNLDLNTGIGKFTISADILGASKIDHGIGKANINLLGKIEDYQINIEKGIGSIKINDKDINNDDIIGSGKNKIDIDAGIGSITIDF